MRFSIPLEVNIDGAWSPWTSLGGIATGRPAAALSRNGSSMCFCPRNRQCHLDPRASDSEWRVGQVGIIRRRRHQ